MISDRVRVALAAWATATLTAIVVVPTPPFGLKTATMRRRPVDDAAADGRAARGRASAGSGEERLDPGLELARVEGPGDDVVGAGLEEPDPLLDVVGLADAQDRDRGQARRRRGSRGRRRPAVVAGPVDVDDDEAVVAGRAGRPRRRRVTVSTA